MKKFLGILALSPVAAMAASDWDTATLPSADVTSAVNAATAMGTELAQKIGPAVLAIGASFLIVAVAFFCYRLVVKFLAGSKRG